jgi:hypothetical protein
MANGTSTSHARLTIAEILVSPDRHEAYLAEVAAWAHDQCVPAAIHRNTITITGNTEPAPTRRQVTDALLDEADWLAERLTAARTEERAWIAHMLMFTGLGQETAVLSKVCSELRPRLLRQGIDIRNYSAGLSPWPCFALHAFIPQLDSR